jgi:cysteine desulfurase
MSTARPEPPAGFLDAASGQPLHPAARSAWLTAVDQGWADPQRLHHEGRRAALFLAAAREEVAAAFGARPDEVTFTGSGSAALGRAVARFAGPGPALTSAVEHSAVPAALRTWAGEVVTVGVDRLGRVDPYDFAPKGGRPGGLAILQTANHEVGTRQPVTAVAEVLGKIPLILDAAASVGREPIAEGWAALIASARKWGGPAAVGVLVDRRHPTANVLDFNDVPGAVAAAAALTAVLADSSSEAQRHTEMIATLRAKLPNLITDLELAGDPEDRLPHILNLSCLYVDGEALVHELDRRDFAVSSGSACASTSGEPSHILAAMGVLTHGNIRISLPNGVAAADVERLITVLPDAVSRVRSELAGV